VAQERAARDAEGREVLVVPEEAAVGAVPEAAEMPQLSTFLMPRASPHWDKKNQPIINTLINAPFTRLNKWQFGLKCIFKLMKTRCGEMRKIKSLTFCDPSPSQKREINLPFPLIPLIHGHFICIKMYVENTPSL